MFGLIIIEGKILDVLVDSDEVKNVNRGLGDVQFMDPDEDAEIIFNTIVASEKEKS